MVSNEPLLAVTTFPMSTSRRPARPSMGERLDGDHLARHDLADPVEIDRHVPRHRRRHRDGRGRPLKRGDRGLFTTDECQDPENDGACLDEYRIHLVFLLGMNFLKLIFWSRGSRHLANRLQAEKFRSRSALSSTGVSSVPEPISSWSTASRSVSNRRRKSSSVASRPITCSTFRCDIALTSSACSSFTTRANS